MKKIIILGADGMLGYGVNAYFTSKNYKVTAVGRNDFDVLRDPVQKLEKFLDPAGILINCIGIVKPRINSLPIESILTINTAFPRSLAKLCQQKSIPCFHITTDCVYSGQKGNYTEHDSFDANDTYGLSKLGGETCDCMTIRTSIIGEEKYNNYSLLEWVRKQENQTVKGFTDHIWNGVTTTYFAEIVETILAQGLYQPGIFHIFSPQSLTKYELVNLIASTYSIKVNILASESTQKCDRSLSSIFTLSETVATKPLHQQLIEMKQIFDTNRIYEQTTSGVHHYPGL